MKLKATRAAILDALQAVQGVVSTRTTLPILGNALLKAEKDKLWITTTDLEVSVRSGVQAEVTKAGASTMPARRLMSIIRELPAEDIELEVDDKHVATIKCGASLFKIMGLADDEFPPLPDFSSGFSYAMEQNTFKQMLNRTAYGASTDETRYVLNGVYLNFVGDKMIMVATDGRRLALAEQEMEFPKEAETGVIVPTKAITELLHSLKEQGQLKIFCTAKQAAFEFDDNVVVTKLIDGTYPNFRQVIPSQCAERVELEREALLTAVRRAALLTSEKSNSVRLTFTKNKVKISAVTPEVGEAHESMSIKYGGKEISVAFNPEYLMDPLRHLTSDVVYLEMTDDLSPGVIKCEVPFLYVLMPMRVN